MMRFRVKKTFQYVLLASVVLLLWREFDRLDRTDDAKSSGVNAAAAERQPLVAGVNVHRQEPVVRRAAHGGGGSEDGGVVGGGGHGGGGGVVAGGGRGPLWQNNKHGDVVPRQRESATELDSKFHPAANVLTPFRNKTRSDGPHVRPKWNNANEHEANWDAPKVLTVQVSEPKPVDGQDGNPVVHIKDLSNLVARRPAPGAPNFTIVVRNGDIPSKPQNQINKQLELSDVFIGVKTTEKYHRDRLQIILDTWYSLAPEQTQFFTDVDDLEFQQKANGHMVNTQCQGTHSRLALCCKTSVIFNMFYKSNKRWLCNVDDDNYLNVPELIKLLRQFDPEQDHYLGRASLSHPIEAIDRDTNQRVSFWFATGGAGFCISKALAMKMAVYASSGTFERMCNRIRLPDDVTIGFIIEVLLKKPLTKVQTFNSHLQQLKTIPHHQLQNQITLSYSITPKRVNIINLPSSLYTIDEDPTRFKTFHCTYFRGYGNCPPTS